MRPRYVFLSFFAFSVLSTQSHSASWSDACPGLDVSFSAFFEKFVEDREFQNLRIFYPLVIRDGIGFDQGLTVKALSEKSVRNLKYPLILKRKTQQEADIEEQITLSTERYVEVLLMQRETDRYVQTFQFRKHGDCWFLEGIMKGSS